MHPKKRFDNGGNMGVTQGTLNQSEPRLCPTVHYEVYFQIQCACTSDISVLGFLGTRFVINEKTARWADNSKTLIGKDFPRFDHAVKLGHIAASPLTKDVKTPRLRKKESQMPKKHRLKEPR
jgi:hypothetical protein